MKTFNVLATLTLFGLQAAAWAAPVLEPGTYTIDSMHSKVGFEVAHLVISSVEGRFKTFDGTIVVDKSGKKSRADVSIDAASVDTDVEKRDAFRDADRVVPRQHDHRRPEHDPLGAAGIIGQQLERRRRHRVAGEMMLERE